MGLTNLSLGIHAADSGLFLPSRGPRDRVVALAGNPNVGKSTVFNALTGMHQHTGNWPGKTVANAQGLCETEQYRYYLVDIPGTYSLMAHSAEEEVARNFLCFGHPDGVIVVCDATCLERNLNLVLQILEAVPHAVVCLNLMDEARRKHIKIDVELLSERLGVPVVGVTARQKRSLTHLTHTLDQVMASPRSALFRVTYPPAIEEAVSRLSPVLTPLTDGKLDTRWLALQLLNRDEGLMAELTRYLGKNPEEDPALAAVLRAVDEDLNTRGLGPEYRKDALVSSLVTTAQLLCRDAVTYENTAYRSADRRWDRLLTSRLTGYPVMLLLLAMIFWLTMEGANYPSQFLSRALFWVQDRLSDGFSLLGAPDWLHDALVLGVYRVLAWVVSVMLPPMAIFFPLFTLLEDIGYLPRVAYNLDRPFHRCRACGKQALTMCMGFGCNAAGVVGCRIIDSSRERLLAVLTNSFVPCNGRFPTLTTLLTLFFIGTVGGAAGSLLSALLLTGLILLSVLVTFGITKLLSHTLLKGMPSSFTLELPPYRRPQVGRVILSSLKDRTLFVLGRAAAVAAPAGLILWLLANITVQDTTLLAYGAAFLDPFARLMGLDGVILIAFILGFPANEIVIPIIMMAYMAQGTLTEWNPAQLYALLVEHGWTATTALCTMLFSLFHWPCSTTLLTVHKETGSLKWTAVAALLPTTMGILLCLAVNGVSSLLSL